MNSVDATCIVVDDELGSRKNLILLLSKFVPNLKVLGSASSASEARALLESYDPDIIFLDVQMPGEDGFEFLESLKSRNFALIFVTAFERYALRAIKASAIDYLLKPVDINELQRAVSKCIELNESDKVSSRAVYSHSIENFLNDIENQDFPEKLTLPHKGSFIIREVKDIEYLEASGNYTNFHFTGGQVLVIAKTLKYYDEMLDPSEFIRVNRSVVVNLSCLEVYSLKTGDIVLANELVFSTSRRRRKEVDMKIHAFQQKRSK